MSVDRPARPKAWTCYLLLGMTAGLLATAAACGDTATPIPTSTATPVPAPTTVVTEEPVYGPMVRVAEVVFPVELAVEPEDRFQGLSGRAFLDSGTGMLFVFEEEDRLRFWMREMEFSLDIIWIDAECRVVDISENVPAPDPGTPLDALPRYSPDAPARYVLEINGGESAARGLGAGDPVEFLNELAGMYGC